MPLATSRWLAGACVAVMVLSASCAYPPQSEMASSPQTNTRPALSASATVTWRPPGGAQAITWTTSYARDSQGRTRLDTIVLGTASSDGRSERIVLISDPVSHQYWRIYPASGKVFRRGQSYDDLQRFSGWTGEPPLSGPPSPRSRAGTSGPCTIAGQTGGSFEIVHLLADGTAAGRTQRCLAPWSGGLNLQVRQTSADGTLEFSFVVDALHFGEPPATDFAPPAAAAPAPAANRALAAALFHQAREAASDLPPELAAGDLQTIAQDELTALPQDDAWQQQAWTDLVSTFRQIVSIALPQPTPPLNAPPDWVAYNPKESIEADFVRMLTNSFGRQRGGSIQAQMQTVLDLIRQADVRKAPLYDVLLSSNIYFAPVNSKGLPDPIALVYQCQQADDSFPYDGVLQLLTHSGAISFSRGPMHDPAGLDQEAASSLVHMADAAAEADQDPAGWSDAVNFLVRTAPVPPAASAASDPRFPVDLTASRGEWEAAAEALLRDHHPPSWTAALLLKLQQLDPDAAVLVASPDAATPRRAAGVEGGGPAAVPPSVFNPDSIQSNPQAAIAAAEAESGPEALPNLSNIANVESYNDPLMAARAASAAVAVLQTTISDPSSRFNFSGLLRALDSLGMTDRADALLPVLLRRAAQDAQTDQANFDRLSPGQQNGSEYVGGDTASEFAMIARMDLTAAAAAARKLDAPVVKPLVLAAAASQIH